MAARTAVRVRNPWLFVLLSVPAGDGGVPEPRWSSEGFSSAWDMEQPPGAAPQSLAGAGALSTSPRNLLHAKPGRSTSNSTENLITVDPGPWKHKVWELLVQSDRNPFPFGIVASSVIIICRQITQIFLHALLVIRAFNNKIVRWKNNRFPLYFSAKMRRKRQRISAVF